MEHSLIYIAIQIILLIANVVPNGKFDYFRLYKKINITYTVFCVVITLISLTVEIIFLHIKLVVMLVFIVSASMQIIFLIVVTHKAKKKYYRELRKIVNTILDEFSMEVDVAFCRNIILERYYDAIYSVKDLEEVIYEEKSQRKK